MVMRYMTFVLVGLLAFTAIGCRKKTVKRTSDDKAATTQAVSHEEATAKRIEARAKYAPVPGRYGGRLVMAGFSEPKSFNPITASETTTSLYTGLIYLGLTTTDKWTFEVVPQLATEWTCDESGLVWTVKLRKGVTWSDGHPFGADDVLFHYSMIYDERWVCSMRDILTGPNGETWELEKIDDHTVRFTLFAKNAIFPQLIGDGVTPKHIFEPIVEAGKLNEAFGVSVDPADVVGTGPYLLESYETGSKVIMRRNPRYYKTDAAGNRQPYLDQLVFLKVGDLDGQMLKFSQGEIDYTGIRGSDYPIFKPEQEAKNFTLHELGPALGSSFVFFNQNTGTNPTTSEPYVAPHKLKWFRDARFRRAVSHAVDRKFIVDAVLNGLGYPQYGPLQHRSGFFFCNANTVRYEYDLDKARALLTSMGFADRNDDGVLEDPDGNDLEFNLTTNSGNNVRERIAETIRKDLTTLGMKVNYRPMNFNILISKLDSTFDWEACVMSLTGGPEPHWGANIWKSSGRMHMWFPSQETPSTPWEAEIDELFAAGVEELDPAKRRNLYFRWQDIVAEQQPFVYTVTPERVFALRHKFGNIFPAPFGGVEGRGGAFADVDEVFILAD